MSHTHMSSPMQTYQPLLRPHSFVIGLTACSGSENPPPPITPTGTPGAEEAIGERLFLDTRLPNSPTRTSLPYPIAGVSGH
jgi:hypothetical protein